MTGMEFLWYRDTTKRLYVSVANDACTEPADVAFVLDGSGWPGAAAFQQQKGACVRLRVGWWR